MSPDLKYPELATLKTNEVFVEFAIIVKRPKNIKLSIKRTFKKSEVEEFVKSLKSEYNLTRSDDPARDEKVELITIHR